jgi:hypothetical protein
MSKVSLIFFSLVLIALFAVGAAAQGTTKHFEKAGFSFDYPSSWTLTEGSKPQALDISLKPAGSELQINLYVREEVFHTPESMEDAKSKVVESHIAGNVKQLQAYGLKPDRTEGTSTLGGQPAQLTNIKADLDGDKGGNEVHWAFLNERLIIFTTFGSDADVKKLSAQLTALRNSMAIAGPAAAPATTTPKPN